MSMVGSGFDSWVTFDYSKQQQLPYPPKVVSSESVPLGTAVFVKIDRDANGATIARPVAMIVNIGPPPAAEKSDELPVHLL